MRHIRSDPCALARAAAARLSLAALVTLTVAACVPRSRPALELAGSPARRALAGADSLEVENLAPGVIYLRAWQREGPWAIHVVEVDSARCSPRWSARKAAGPLVARALTSALADSALAAVNADFFQLPGGTPVGPHVHGGRVWIGPGNRPAWLANGPAMFAGPARLAGEVVAGTDTVALVQVNRAARATSNYTPPGRGATLFTALAEAVPPADSAGDVVHVRVQSGTETEGQGVVLRVHLGAVDSAALAPGEAALQLIGDGRAWAARRQPGDTVRWRASVLPARTHGPPATEAVGGFPELLRAGLDVLAETTVLESFGAQRHPRTAIGWSTDTGRIYLVVVDGRQLPYSAGMTLAELLQLFRALGATDALNLDGGGSTAIVIRGILRNRPSDQQGERAVGNALALAGCGGRTER